MRRQRDGGVKGGSAPGSPGASLEDSQSEIRDREVSPGDGAPQREEDAFDDFEPPPTMVRPVRPPTPSILDADGFGAPTRERRVELPPRFPKSQPDDATLAPTRVVTPDAPTREFAADSMVAQALADEEADDDGAPTMLRSVARRPVARGADSRPPGAAAAIRSRPPDPYPDDASLREPPTDRGLPLDGASERVPLAYSEPPPVDAFGEPLAESEPPPPDSAPPLDSDPPPSDGFASLQGRRIGRNCQLGPAFARGGMATVHLGRWFGAGGFAKTVAVKRLHQQFASDPEFVAMLLDEARVVARIRHGNVTSVVDAVEDGQELFLVMDYVHGVTLAHLARQMKRSRQEIPLPIAMRIVSGILHGLQAAHDASDEHGDPLCLIHRDVSPENIIVGSDGHAQLIDFGIARAVGRSTETADGQIKGKVRYCSPEQLRGEALEPASDIYAASIVLWEAVCGRQLYRGDHAGTIVYEILQSEVAPPSQLRVGLSPAFDEIVLRGLSPDKNSRWLTAADMAEALERAVPMATIREVGDWVKAVARDKLATMSQTLKVVESMPPMPEQDVPPLVTRGRPPSQPPTGSGRDRRWMILAGIVVLGAFASAWVLRGNAFAPSSRSSADEAPTPRLRRVLVPAQGLPSRAREIEARLPRAAASTRTSTTATVASGSASVAPTGAPATEASAAPDGEEPSAAASAAASDPSGAAPSSAASVAPAASASANAPAPPRWRPPPRRKRKTLWKPDGL